MIGISQCIPVHRVHETLSKTCTLRVEQEHGGGVSCGHCVRHMACTHTCDESNAA